MVALIDYGAGNLASVSNALAALGAPFVTATHASAVPAGCSHVILPGVGAFGDAMGELRARGLDRPVIAAAQNGVPLLGICLGLQLLFEASEESRGAVGLGLLPGQILRLLPADASMKIPHMGWNTLQVKPHPLFAGLPENPAFYFVHGYHAAVRDAGIVIATCDYGRPITAMVARGNIFGAQCHPEKSGTAGMKWLQNFLSMKGATTC